MDPRINKLADLLVDYSVAVKPGDNVFVSFAGEEARPFVRTLIEKIYAAGGHPYVHRMDRWIERALILGADEEQIKNAAQNVIDLMKQMDCYIGFSAPDNSAELSGIPAEKMKRWNNHYVMPIAMVRCKTTRWVVLRYPSAAAAQAMDMSTDTFEDYFFKVTTMDYKAMAEAVQPLADLMARTDKVRIVGPGTDLSFSIKDIGVTPCVGHSNIPDGEIYTAPVIDSVNGTLSYNTPAPCDGFTFENICFRFENGKIVEATANDTERLNSFLDIDDGARFVGEFAIGFHPYITTPMKNILFDEKIAGSFHFTPGMSYEDCGNGNKSAIHWDLVCIQTPEYGGGEIWFDDVLIRKDGLFVLPELEGLNPANLG